MASDEHTHLYRVPEPLEKLFEQLGEIERAAGPAAADDAARVRELIQNALAAEARGEVAGAIQGITGAMQAIARLAARVDPAEGGEMSRVAEQFGRALLRGDEGEARASAERMRDRAGARVVKRD